MPSGDIVSVTQRPLSDEESDLLAWFEDQERKSVDNVEAGARQLISLISAFYGLVFGVVSLGKDKMEASLSQPGTLVLGGAAILLLFLALIAALAVVWPRRYRYRDASLSDMRAVFEAMLARKSNWLGWALLAFGSALAAFGGMIFLLLLYRLP